MVNASQETLRIIERARELGFGAAGIAAVTAMDPAPFRAWLEAGHAAGMDYLARHLPLRADLPSVLPGAHSVICAALPYPGPQPGDSAVGAVAKYARGADYHEVVRERLTLLWDELQREYPEAQGRVFVDSGPLPERELARRAGVGWVGKHSCLIHPELGTRFVLGEILTTLALEPTLPITGSCGNCRRCLGACPTGALAELGVVDARRCLSYLTIEHKGPLPRELRPLLGTRLFGCDACQDACPHNRKLQEINSPLTPAPDLLAPDLPALLLMPAEDFTRRFRGTALHRAKRRGVLRNACVALGNLGDPAYLPPLLHALHDSEPLVRGHAAWALGRLGAREALEEALEHETDEYVREEIALAL
ncbi:MAG: tRNA epoxyqueuosine(34) reductase QueG [Armatimonadota bacterium]